MNPFTHIGGQIEMESRSIQNKIKCLPTPRIYIVLAFIILL